jgi:hypothetical protein
VRVGHGGRFTAPGPEAARPPDSNQFLHRTPQQLISKRINNTKPRCEVRSCWVHGQPLGAGTSAGCPLGVSGVSAGEW